MAKARRKTIRSARPRSTEPNSSDNLKGRRSPWGIEVQPEEPRTYLLLPREGADEDPQTTFSPAAANRQVPLGVTLAVKRPSKPANVALERVGLVDYLDRTTDQNRRSKHGIFSMMNHLGVTACVFGEDKAETDARTELEDQYEFVPDFKLSLPLRVTSQQARVSRTRIALSTAEWPAESGVQAAHAAGIRGEGVLLGVLDTGIDADHGEFRERRVNYRYITLFPNSSDSPPRDVRGFDTDGHGTHCCGIAAGKTAGVAPEAGLYVAGVIESERISTSLTRTLAGMNWILRQFTRPDNEHLPGVLSMSLGFPMDISGFTGENLTPTQFKQRLGVMSTVLQTMKQANILPVVAIGNDGKNTWGYPGGFPGVLGVGAIDFEGEVADFSGGGNVPVPGSTTKKVKKPDLVGYGVEVMSSIERNYNGDSIFQRLSGTSMATPYVAGIACLYRCRQPGLNVEDITNKILEKCDSTAVSPKTRVGAGLARFVT